MKKKAEGGTPMENFENDGENTNNLKQDGLETEETVNKKENEENAEK